MEKELSLLRVLETLHLYRKMREIYSPWSLSCNFSGSTVKSALYMERMTRGRPIPGRPGLEIHTSSSCVPGRLPLRGRHAGTSIRNDTCPGGSLVFLRRTGEPATPVDQPVIMDINSGGSEIRITSLIDLRALRSLV